MWRMLQQPVAEDFVIATGETRPLQDFVAGAFACVGLDWREHVLSDKALLRPTDLQKGWANPGKAAHQLGWRAEHRLDDVVRLMVEAQR